jgi:hypothetical protein
MRTSQITVFAMVLTVVGCAAPRPIPSRAVTPSNQPATTPPSRSASPSSVVEPVPAISIDAGLTPRLTPDEVATQVIHRIHAMEDWVGQVTKPPRVVSIQARAVDGGIQWTVRAEGTFTSGRPRVSPLPVAASGYFVISDADGTVLGFGFP